VRKLVSIAAAVASLTLGSTGAHAAVTVTSSSGYTDPQGNPCSPVCGTAPANQAVATNAAGGSIVFGQNPSGLSFDTSFIFNNDVAGFYNIDLGTSTGGLLFNLVTVMGGGTTTTFAPPSTSLIQQFGITLLGNTNYTVRIAGTSPVASGEFHGGITVVNGAVPEPATWAMMLLGFGAMGLSMRRRRRATYLPQIA